MKKLDWNRERYRTRDLLLEYELPFSTYSSNSSIIYPQNNIQLSVLSKQIYEIAKKYGYFENEEAFWTKFSNSNIVYSTIQEFPVIGDENKLYFDKESGILYYFVSSAKIIYHELADALDVIISGTSVKEGQEITYLYIPIKAMPIENLIYSGGEVNE